MYCIVNPPNSSTKHNIKNTKMTVAKIATSDGQSLRELQVESNCLCVLWHRAYSTSLRCIRMLRLSALSLQMASQVRALTLLAPPASFAARARSAQSVCRGRKGGGRTFSHHSNAKCCLQSSPSGAAGTEYQSRCTSVAFGKWSCRRTCLNVSVRSTRVPPPSSRTVETFYTTVPCPFQHPFLLWSSFVVWVHLIQLLQCEAAKWEWGRQGKTVHSNI